MTNSHSSLAQTTPNRQVSTTVNTEYLQSEDRVYSYSDFEYTGTLEIPFSDDDASIIILKLQQKITDLRKQKQRLQEELEQAQQEKQNLEKELNKAQQENQRLKEELKQAKHTIRNAKDISPIMRPSLKRVLRLAKEACMNVRRTVGGWVLTMGDKARKFRRLADIWHLLVQHDWYLSDIFPPDKLIPIHEIKPPRLRKSPTPPVRKSTLPVSPNRVQLWRKIGLPVC